MFSSEVRWRVSWFFLFCFLALRIDCTGDGVISANGDNWMKMVKWIRSCRPSRIVLVLTVNEDPAMKGASSVDDDVSSSKVCDFWNLYKWNNITAVGKNARALKSLHRMFITYCFSLWRCESLSKIRLTNLCIVRLWMSAVVFWQKGASVASTHWAPETGGRALMLLSAVRHMNI